MADLFVALERVTETVPWTHIRPGHLRSTAIEQDYGDPASSRDYVVTPFIEATLQRVLKGLATGSRERAWRLTGDYGAGKSSFALALAHVLAARDECLPSALRSMATPGRLEPVFVAGDREPVAASLKRALAAMLDRCGGTERARRRLHQTLGGADVSAGDAIAALDSVRDEVARVTGAVGLLVIFDELGKNLEYASARPGANDVYLLQHIAEAAARSGDAPLVLVALLHQSVSSYAQELTSGERREWEKVAGRFEEVVFLHPIEQAAFLVAAALDVSPDQVPRRLRDSVSATMCRAVAAGWYGYGASEEELAALAPRLLPMDPTTLPVLTRVLRRFGQNERSLFGFLSSTEPGGLMEFAAGSTRQPAEPQLYRLYHLFDYVAANLGSAIAAGPRSLQWGVIEAVVRSASVNETQDLQILKTVGVLNLLDDPALPATREVVALCVGGRSGGREAEAVQRLADESGLLFDRGRAGGLCLWPHTSVDLEAALSKAHDALGPQGGTASALIPLASSQPLIARRHTIERGTLRHFDVIYTTGTALVDAIGRVTNADLRQGADGYVIVVLCDTLVERARALETVRTRMQDLPRTVLIGLPEPVGTLQGALREAQAWAWVKDHTPELIHDRFAQIQVQRQVDLARDRLTRALADVADLRGGAAPLFQDWFQRGAPLVIRSGRDLLETVSRICDAEFASAPWIRNELINRRSLSSAAARARSELIEAIALRADRPLLGMNADRTPPEMAIYLSILREGGVHVERDGRWLIQVPPEGHDPLYLGPALRRLGEVLRKAGDLPVLYEDLAADLRQPPFGVRDGVFPLLLSIYLAAHWHRTAVYEDGTYLEQVGAPEFSRMLKEPEHFAIQHCAVEGVRAEIFARLAQVIEVASAGPALDILEIVRPLCQFVARLPEHARRTRQLSASTVAVRAALIDARDPTRLVFHDLPQACGTQLSTSQEALDLPQVDAFVRQMGRAVRELRDAYPRLLDRIASVVARAFECEGDLVEVRRLLTRRAARLTTVVTETELRALILRLEDAGLSDRAWLEALASYVIRKPPERWADRDEIECEHRLTELTQRFRRVEAAQLTNERGQSATEDPHPDHPPLRLAVTAADGREVVDVLRSSPHDARRLAEVEGEVANLLAQHGRLGAVAVARALLGLLSGPSSGTDSEGSDAPSAVGGQVSAGLAPARGARPHSGRRA